MNAKIIAVRRQEDVQPIPLATKHRNTVKPLKHREANEYTHKTTTETQMRNTKQRQRKNAPTRSRHEKYNVKKKTM